MPGNDAGAQLQPRQVTAPNEGLGNFSPHSAESFQLLLLQWRFRLAAKFNIHPYLLVRLGSDEFSLDLSLERERRPNCVMAERSACLQIRHIVCVAVGTKIARPPM